MRVTDRILSTCSAAAIAALCLVVMTAADAQAARPQAQDARTASSRPVSAAPVRAGAPQRVSLPQPTATLRAAQSGKLRGDVAAPTSKSGNIKSAKLRVAGSAIQQSWGGISCVPFARAATGLDVKGNAHAWWGSAAGSYERGQRPEAGKRAGRAAVDDRVNGGGLVSLPDNGGRKQAVAVALDFCPWLLKRCGEGVAL